MIASTSLLSYYKHLENGNIENMQDKVLEAVRFFPDLTGIELSKLVGFRVNSRLTELYEQGLVFRPSKRKCRFTGETAYIWRVI